jgi:transposase
VGEPIRKGLPAPIKPQIGLIFDQILALIKQHGLLAGRRKVRTDATKLVADVAFLGRADALQEALRIVVCDLHKYHPSLLAQPEFRQLHETYGEENWLGREGNAESRLVRLGRDGYRLLELCGARLAAGKDTLERMLAENFVRTDDGELMPLANDQIASDHIASPHDPDAKVGKKDRDCWIGDKVHLTETADEGQPPFIIDVVTTDPRIDDSEMTVELAQRAKQRLPSVTTMVADTGYASAANTTDCATEGLDLVSRPRPCTSPSQIPPHEFEYDFERQVARCPEGHASASWRVEGHQFAIRFSAKACAACPRRAECTTSSAHGRRVRIGPNYAQLLADRQRSETDEFADEYRGRSAIESTISHLVHRCGLRRSRYRGAAKRALHAMFAATALNVRRLLPCLLPENGNAVAPNGA